VRKEEYDGWVIYSLEEKERKKGRGYRVRCPEGK